MLLGGNLALAVKRDVTSVTFNTTVFTQAQDRLGFKASYGEALEVHQICHPLKNDVKTILKGSVKGF